MTKKATPEQTDAPSLLLDGYGNPGLVAAGQLIESAWGNAIVGRTVMRFPDKAALDTVAPSNGALAVTVNEGVVWFGAGGTWHPTAIGGRISFRLIGGAPGQSMAPGGFATCSWHTEASDPYNVVGPPGTFTCPAGWAGRWTFVWSVEWPDGGQAGTRERRPEAGHA